MARIFRLMIIVLTASLLSTTAMAGVKIKINSASVIDNTLTLNGINFEVGTIVAIGGTVLEDCTVTPNSISCNLPEGLVITENSSWTVSISAGNSPAKNDEIDVYIPSPNAPACNNGDIFECYSGDMSTKDVGECHSGYRTCINGAWSVCEGEVTPTEEICGDNLDNDCDGVVNNGCTKLCTETEIQDLNDCMNETEDPFECLQSVPLSDECRTAITELSLCGFSQGCSYQNWWQQLGCLYEVCPDKWDVAFGLDYIPPSECSNGSQQECGTDIGACQKGIQTCIYGVWSSCEGAIFPGPEICDGIDNDCDGSVDEECECISPEVNCNGQCVDLSEDPLNCGSCGNECPEDNICIDSQCISPT